MSEREELEERLAWATIARDEAQEEDDIAAADLDAWIAEHPEPSAETESPA